MRTVNSHAQAIVGMAYNSLISVGNWNGEANLMVIPLEDLEVILGILIHVEKSHCSIASVGWFNDYAWNDAYFLLMLLIHLGKRKRKRTVLCFCRGY